MNPSLLDIYIGNQAIVIRKGLYRGPDAAWKLWEVRGGRCVIEKRDRRAQRDANGDSDDDGR